MRFCIMLKTLTLTWLISLDALVVVENVVIVAIVVVGFTTTLDIVVKGNSEICETLGEPIGLTSPISRTLFEPVLIQILSSLSILYLDPIIFYHYFYVLNRKK